MTTTTRASRAPRALFPLAMAGALSAMAVAPTVAFADATAAPTGVVKAKWAGPGVGYDKVIDGHSAGTVKLKVEDGATVEAFCIDFDAAVAKGTQTYTSKTYTESGVANVAKAADIAVRHAAMGAVLDLGGSDGGRAENAAAQLAIWKLTDGKDFSKVPNAAIVHRANYLFNHAAVHAESASSVLVTGAATVEGRGEDAQDTVVAEVKTDAGVGVPGQTVRFTVAGQTLTAVTDADGKATVQVDAPRDETPMALSVDATIAGGTVLVPAGQQAMVTTADATVTREGTVTLPKEPTVVEETPSPVPTHTDKPAPHHDANPHTNQPKEHAPKAPVHKTPPPKVLPHTGGWATTGMFGGAIALAGAGFAGRRFFRRS